MKKITIIVEPNITLVPLLEKFAKTEVIFEFCVSLIVISASVANMLNKESINKKVTKIETLKPRIHHPSKINYWFYSTKN